MEIRRQFISAKAEEFSGVAGLAPAPKESTSLGEATTGGIGVSSTFVAPIDPFLQSRLGGFVVERGDLGQQAVGG